jgi:hypothetical protein
MAFVSILSTKSKQKKTPQELKLVLSTVLAASLKFQISHSAGFFLFFFFLTWNVSAVFFLILPTKKK